MPKTSALKYLYDTLKKGNEWIDKVPREINDHIFDNPYINAYYMTNDKLIKMAFGEYAGAVNWLIYDWKRGCQCGIDGEMLVINTPEEYYRYLIDHEGWEE